MLSQISKIVFYEYIWMLIFIPYIKCFHKLRFKCLREGLKKCYKTTRKHFLVFQSNMPMGRELMVKVSNQNQTIRRKRNKKLKSYIESYPSEDLLFLLTLTTSTIQIVCFLVMCVHQDKFIYFVYGFTRILLLSSLLYI